MTTPTAFIAGIGMITAVGDCAAQTATSVRAGINRYKESKLLNKSFEPMILALCPDKSLPPLNDILVDKDINGRHIRMLRLAHKAVAEAMDGWDIQLPMPLFLAGPETYPNYPLAITDTFINQLVMQTGLNFDRSSSRLHPNGRAGGMAALKSALEFLRIDGNDFAVLGGVDSHLDLELLSNMDKEDRILAEGIMDGFAPGEGAGFLLLCSEHYRQTNARHLRSRIHYPGLAKEDGHRFSTSPYKGEGLSAAINQSLANCNIEPINTVLCSLNGENFGSKEWGVSFSRNNKSIDKSYTFIHPASCFGDIGAATSTVLIGLAAIGQIQGYIKAPSLAWSSSDGGPRGASCISLAAAS